MRDRGANIVEYVRISRRLDDEIALSKALNQRLDASARFLAAEAMATLFARRSGIHKLYPASDAVRFMRSNLTPI